MPIVAGEMLPFLGRLLSHRNLEHSLVDVSRYVAMSRQAANVVLPKRMAGDLLSFEKLPEWLGTVYVWTRSIAS